MVSGRSRGASHVLATARSWLVASAVGLAGCGDERVEARAVWVQDFGDPLERRVRIYDRGQFDELVIRGETGPRERIQLAPDGRGLLVRGGTRRGAWYDLDDGRRFPLLLPDPSLDESVHFARSGGALWWSEDDGASLAVLPLAPGFELERREDGTVVPLIEPESVDWVRDAPAAPRLLVKVDARVSILRYPDGPGQAPLLTHEASASHLELPAHAETTHTCGAGQELGCFARVAFSPTGALAILSPTAAGPWQLLERRAPQLAGPLELPPKLAAAEPAGLRLLAALDAEVTIWLGAGVMFRLERSTGALESLPIYAAPPLHWATVEHGRALVLLSTSGPMIRAQRERLQALSVETTDCAHASTPVLSPSGRWAAWTCRDPGAERTSTSGIVVRVSRAGLERFVGVPMEALAIDDTGGLLLDSVSSSTTDALDGIAPNNVPQSLFVLSDAGVLTRVDELEPAPVPTETAPDLFGFFIQAAAL